MTNQPDTISVIGNRLDAYTAHTLPEQWRRAMTPLRRLQGWATS